MRNDGNLTRESCPTVGRRFAGVRERCAEFVALVDNHVQ